MALRDRYLKDQAVGRAAQEKCDDSAHPLLRSAADRDIRDAYFYGLVFAAFANDEQGVVDEQERAKLLEIGGLLKLSTSEVEQAIARVDSLGVADKMALIEECVRGWKDPVVVSAFLAEFETIWKIGGGSYEDLSGFYTDFEKWMDPQVAEGIMAARASRAETVISDESKENPDKTDQVAEPPVAQDGKSQKDDTQDDIPSLKKTIRVVGQRVKIDRVIEFFKGDEVEFENSELVFVAGKGSIKATNVSLKFLGCRLSVENHDPAALVNGDDTAYLIRGTGEDCPRLEVSACDFVGGSNRGAIYWTGNLQVGNCTFSGFELSTSDIYEAQAVIYVQRGGDQGSLKIEKTLLRGCKKSNGGYILRGPELNVEKSVFIGCQSQNLLGYINSFHARVRECKFKNCKSTGRILFSGNADHLGRSDDGFFDCCFVNFDYDSRHACERQVSFKVDTPESEFDANWEKWTGAPMRGIEVGGSLKPRVGALGVSGEIEPIPIVIRNRKVRIDRPLRVASDIELIIENSELIFGRKGVLKIDSERVTIRNTVFRSDGDQDWDHSDWFVQTEGVHSVVGLNFLNCSFIGNGACRGVVSLHCAITLQDSELIGLKHSSKSLVEAKSVNVRRCRIVNCCTEGSSSSLITADDISICRTLFEDCKAENKMLQWHGANHSFEVRECKFKNCVVHNNLIGNPSWGSNGFVGPFGFFDCCFVNVQHYGGLTLSYENQISKQVDMSEDEFDSRFQCP